MASRKVPVISVHVSKSVESAFAALVGISAGYILWKLLGDNERTPRKGIKRQIPGLANVGNSCFMNVLLQSFASCPSFTSWIEDFVKDTSTDEDHVYLAQVVMKILRILTGEEEVDDYYFDPSELLQDMHGRGWQISSQEQDSHEFYHAVMTTLIEEYRHHVERKIRTLGLYEVDELLSSPIQRLHVHEEAKKTEEAEQEFSSQRRYPSFHGTLANVLQCQTCGFKHPIRYDGFDSLSLPLPSDLSWMAQISVVDCLRSFLGPELVNNVECVNCGRIRFADDEPRPPDKNNRQNTQSKVSDAISNAVKELSIIGTPTERPTGSILQSDAAKDSLNIKSVSTDSEATEDKPDDVITNGDDIISEHSTVSNSDVKHDDDVRTPSELASLAKDIISGDINIPDEPSDTMNLTDVRSDEAITLNEPLKTVNEASSINQTDQSNKSGMEIDSGTSETQAMSENCNEIKCDCSHLKPPFPELVITTQRDSFNKYFLRRRPRMESARQVIYPPVKRTFQRCLSFGKLPDCLCMHIQRLVWMEGTPLKKMNFVRFPEILDVGPFTEISRIQEKSSRNKDSFAETIKSLTPLQMQKALIMRRAASAEDSSSTSRTTTPLSLQGGSGPYGRMKNMDSSSSKQSLYKLMSVIVHVGDWSFSGHFLAYRRSPESTEGSKSEWIFTSDTMVRKATREEVFSCPAYMLFYERIKQ